jgi:hypothetical protein
MSSTLPNRLLSAHSLSVQFVSVWALDSYGLIHPLWLGL